MATNRRSFGIQFVFITVLLSSLTGLTSDMAASIDPPSLETALADPAAAPQKGQRTLTFSERVICQYAIEKVYWRHRLWPKDNIKQKPEFDSVISREQIEAKVLNNLRASQIAGDQLGTPIAAIDLQAEIERIASHTQQPGVLRELFSSLDNNPLLVAECLAKPILAERIVRNTAIANKPLLVPHSPTELAIPSVYTLPPITGSDSCTDAWTATAIINAPVARDGHTAVWTGSEMIIWGGEDIAGNMINTGGKYDPATDSWVATNIDQAPTVRWNHTAVWTGTEMVVWGGGGNGTVNTGGKYNPITDTWTATSTTNVPASRIFHAAVWTGTEMIVWGGYNLNERFNSGGKYNPETDTWIATNTMNAPAGRGLHEAVWTGTQMIVWGGGSASGSLNTGGKYDPNADSWTATTTENAPLARQYFTAVWSGTEMIVWGGTTLSAPNTFTGGRYDPLHDSWIATNPGNTPLARAAHTAIWTGSEMIIWGGSAPTGDSNTGGKYDPVTNLWTPMTTVNAPPARELHTAVWTGNEMIVWGGFPHSLALNTGGRYCGHQSSTPTPTPIQTPTSTPAPPTATPTSTPFPSPTSTPPATPSPSPTTTPTPIPTPTPITRAINLSTRLQVEQGDNIGIGGFIITGSVPKHVLLRAIGPSLANFNIPDALVDPVLELHGEGSFVTRINDNWRETQESEIEATGIPPSNDLESAIDITLNPGLYTAVVRGKNDSSGVALIEVYDLNQTAPAKLANISTRAHVDTGPNVVIAGFMLANSNNDTPIVVRGIGPSLIPFGIPNPLADPSLELRDHNGTLLSANNDWQDDPDQAAAIDATGLAPANDLESAILTSLPPGLYTALLAGHLGNSGIGVVEIYDHSQ